MLDPVASNSRVCCRVASRLHACFRSLHTRANERMNWTSIDSIYPRRPKAELIASTQSPYHRTIGPSCIFLAPRSPCLGRCASSVDVDVVTPDSCFRFHLSHQVCFKLLICLSSDRLLIMLSSRISRNAGCGTRDKRLTDSITTR